MKIFESEPTPFREKSYHIKIEAEDNLEPLEIAECFKEQYPKEVCVISFARIVQVEMGIILVGLKLK